MARITSAGDFRITSAGDFRIVAGDQPPVAAFAGTGFLGLDPAPAQTSWNSPQVIPIINRYLAAVRRVVNNSLQGKLNAVLDVTLAANIDTTAINDPRIGVNSSIQWAPLTPTAAAEFVGGSMYLAAIDQGSATLAHSVAGGADRRFRLTIIG
jgi:hypothetical protein